VKSFALLSVLGLALLLPVASEAADGATSPPPLSVEKVRPAQQKQVDRSAPQMSTTRTTHYRIMCYTCGGGYPYRVAAPYIGAGWVLEYGSGCGYGQAWRYDSQPYICSN